MPIYEYRCKDCQKKSDFLVGINQNKTEIKCNHCGSKNLEKLLSKSNIRSDNSRGFPPQGNTCCGREEPCDTPPCSDNGICKR